MSSGTEIAVLKMGMELFTKTTPKGIRWIREWYKRKSVLVVGQKRAGKSTFVDYIQHGIFDDEQETEETLTPTTTRQFKVEIGDSGTLEMSAKATDIPGHIGPKQHAQYAFDSKPHAILIFLDLSTGKGLPKAGKAGEWLSEFCERLDNLCRSRDRRYNRTKCIIVIANKVDQVTTEESDECKKALTEIIKALGEGRGSMSDVPIVKPCVMVTNAHSDKLVAGIVRHLVKALSK